MYKSCGVSTYQLTSPERLGWSLVNENWS